MTVEYVSFGIIIDDILDSTGQTHQNVLGGGGVQTVWGMAAALGTGEKVGLAARVGQDFDPALLSPLKNAQINLDGVQRTDYPTPRAWQILDTHGNRQQTWQTPAHLLSYQLAKSHDILPASYRDAVYFHWGVHPEEVNLALANDLKTAGKFVSLEAFRSPAHLPYPRGLLKNLLRACQVFSANGEETRAIFNTLEPTDTATLARYVARWDEKTIIVVHDGANGADIFHQGRHFHVPAIETTPVDTIGAGNAFCGAFLAGLAEGIENAACHAVVAASYVIEQVGLPDSLPDRIDYQRRFDVAKAGIGL